MSGAKHTPGPWTYTIRPNGAVEIVRDDGLHPNPHVFISTQGKLMKERAIANARVIAAAPDLAHASADFLRWFRTFIGDSAYNEIRSDELDALRAAISKAGL